MTNKELYERINQLQTMKATIDRQQKEFEALSEIVKTELIKRNADELDTGNTKVTYKVVDSSRFDSAAFKAAHPKMYQNFTSTSQIRRFVLKASENFATPVLSIADVA